MPCGGVRNLIYESHCFGSTFTWNADLLQIESAPDQCESPETVVLIAKDGSGLPAGRVYVEFVEDPDGDGRVDPTDHSGSVPASQTVQQVPADGGPGPHVVVVSCDADPNDKFPWIHVRDSVDGPAPEWQTCHETGVFEVEFSKWEITSEGLAVELSVSNLDNKTAWFENAQIELRELAEDGSGVANTWQPDNPDRRVRLQYIPFVRPRFHVVLVFSDVHDEISFEVHYLRPNRSIIIADSVEITPSPGRPRINPGG